MEDVLHYIVHDGIVGGNLNTRSGDVSSGEDSWVLSNDRSEFFFFFQSPSSANAKTCPATIQCSGGLELWAAKSRG